MTFLRLIKRRWWLRVLAVVLVAVGAIGLAGPRLASAAPAAATATPQEQIDQAVNAARAALQQRPECALLLKVEPVFALAPFEPLDVLNTAKRVYQPVPPADAENAAASVAGNAYGNGQTIRIHEQFTKLGTPVPPNSVVSPRFEGQPEGDITDGNLLRAVAILHEVGHLTLVEPSHKDRIDENGNVVSAARREGLYNTRILNTCFAPRYLIAQLTCQQVVHGNASFNEYSSIDCFARCRPDAGPVTMAWASSLQSTVTTDDTGCTSTRVSDCPPAEKVLGFTTATFPPVEIGLTITDAAGHRSTDTVEITCYAINYW